MHDSFKLFLFFTVLILLSCKNTSTSPKSENSSSSGTSSSDAQSGLAPEALDVAIIGRPKTGDTLIGSYTYSSKDEYPEGVSTYRWLRDGSPISGETSKTYVLTQSDKGSVIQFEVTPVSVFGTPNIGKAVQSEETDTIVDNLPPEAHNVTISGTATRGATLTGSFEYYDAEGDVQDSSTRIRWLRDGVEIQNEYSKTYTIQYADRGAIITFEVRTKAYTGSKLGHAFSAKTSAVTGYTPPEARNVTISGTATWGSTLTGHYEYYDAEDDDESGSIRRWLRDGVEIQGEYSYQYTIQSADKGTQITFQVTPVSDYENQQGEAVSSEEVAVLTENVPPEIQNLKITGNAVLGETLSGTYDYYDAEGDLEGTSLFQWLRNGSKLSGETSSSHIIQSDDIGQILSLEVIPVAQTGEVLTGLAQTDSIPVYYINRKVKDGLTDTRDSKSYDIVYIGTQVWMAENLNFERSQGSYCYQDSNSNCDLFGQLYTWPAALNLDSIYYYPNSIYEKTSQGICPTNWHLPTDREWEMLNTYVDEHNGSTGIGKSLKANSSLWNTSPGSDDFGFSALPGNSASSFAPPLSSQGGYWWSATECAKAETYPPPTDDYGFPYVCYQGVNDSTDNVKTSIGRTEAFIKQPSDTTISLALSVRCIQDAP